MCDSCVSAITDALRVRPACRSYPSGNQLKPKAWLKSCSGPDERPLARAAVPFPAMKKARESTLFWPSGACFPSRTAAAGAVRAGEVRVGQRRPDRAAAEPAGRARGGADRRRGPAFRLARRDQARQRARRARHRRRRPRLPRRRRLDRRLHRLPAAARRGARSPRSTSPTGRSTCSCARTRA